MNQPHVILQAHQQDHPNQPQQQQQPQQPQRQPQQPLQLAQQNEQQLHLQPSYVHQAHQFDNQYPAQGQTEQLIHHQYPIQQAQHSAGLHHNEQQQQIYNPMDQFQQEQPQQIQHQQQQQQDDSAEITKQLVELNRISNSLHYASNECRHKQEEFNIALQQRSNIVNKIAQYEKDAQREISERLRREKSVIEESIRQLIYEINNYRSSLISQMKSIFQQVNLIQSNIIYKRLPEWRLKQQILNNNVTAYTNSNTNTTTTTTTTPGATATSTPASTITSTTVTTTTAGSTASFLNAAINMNSGTNISNCDLYSSPTELSSPNAAASSDLPENNKLDQYQIWVELIIDILWSLRTNVRGLHQMMFDCFKANKRLLSHEHIQLGVTIDKALETLVLNCLVVEKQPPQVMKTNTRFGTSVRFLGGSKLGLRIMNPTLYCTILSESRARNVIQRHKELRKYSWACLEEQLEQEHQLISSTPTGQQQQPQTAASNQSPAYQKSNLVDGQQLVQPDLIQSTGQQDQYFQPQAYYMNTTNSSAQISQQAYHNTQHLQQLTPPPNLEHQAARQKAEKDDHRMDDSPYLRYTLQVDPSGDIINGKNNVHFQDVGNQLVWTFTSLQLKKIRRTEKKGTESVMDEKFVCLFDAELRVPETKDTYSWIKTAEISFRLMAVSLPVVVIVHGNQEPHAVATITWHNAFARPDNELFSVPDTVSWFELGRVLSEKFRCYGGKGLSKQNLDYLAKKITRNKQLQLQQQQQQQQMTATDFNPTSNAVSTYNGPEDDYNLMVNWNQFAKETIMEKNFTFWEWFYSILKLTKDHLSKLWEADKIFGFIDKAGCNELLLTRSHHSFSNDGAPVGTFLLRYSESELGGITVAWVPDSSSEAIIEQQQYQLEEDLTQTTTASSTTNSQVKIMHLQPFTNKDLNTRSLADRVGDLESLMYLYPDLVKDEALKDYYTPTDKAKQSSSNDYVFPMLVQTLAPKKSRNLCPTSLGSSTGPALSFTNAFSSSPSMENEMRWNE